MSDLTLSSAELRNLTEYVQHAAQIGWLTRKGWVFVLDRRGRPKVDRAYYESRMGIGHNQDSAPIELDFTPLYG